MNWTTNDYWEAPLTCASHLLQEFKVYKALKYAYTDNGRILNSVLKFWNTDTNPIPLSYDYDDKKKGYINDGMCKINHRMKYDK